jgi:hypothetical protein
MAAVAVTPDLSEDTEFYLVAGAVGAADAREFITWQREMDLPNPEDLLAKPSSLKVAKRADKTYAILSSVVSAVLNDLTEDRWQRGWKVLAEAAKQESADIAAFAAKAFIKANNEAGFAWEPVLNIVQPFTEIMRGAGLLLG